MRLREQPRPAKRESERLILSLCTPTERPNLGSSRIGRKRRLVARPSLHPHITRRAYSRQRFRHSISIRRGAHHLTRMAQPETTKQWEKNVGGSAPGSQQLAPNTYASETALTSPEADVVTKGGSQLQQNESASDSTSPAFPQTVTTAPPPETSPNPRSCVTCRRRKVRCNKHHPCSNCIKAKIECVYPSPGRAPRKSKKPRDTELLARLRTLENIVKNLGGPDAINGNPSSLPLKKTTLHQNSETAQY